MVAHIETIQQPTSWGVTMTLICEAHKDGNYCVLPYTHQHMHSDGCGNVWPRSSLDGSPPKSKPDMVNHPPHYTRGPRILVPPRGILSEHSDDGRPWMIIECIQIIRHIKDVRLATAVKYIWRVAFGGKTNNREDIAKAVWYLNDWLENPIEDQ